MEFIETLKQRKLAMQATTTCNNILPQQKKVVDESLSILNYGSILAKALIGGTIIFGINWSKKVPFTKRQLPLAFGAIGFSALVDYGLSQYVWQESYDIVKKYTGFRGGIFVSPEKMQSMQKMYENKMGNKSSIDASLEDLMENQQ